VDGAETGVGWEERKDEFGRSVGGDKTWTTKSKVEGGGGAQSLMPDSKKNQDKRGG